MKRTLALLLTVVLLLSTAHRAPAPISEESPTPKPKLEATSKPKPKPVQRQRIVVHASEFVRPLNVSLGANAPLYGADVLTNTSNSYRPNAAEFEFSTVRGGRYRLKIEYAAQDARPCRIILNGRPAIENAMSAPTGCWAPTCQQLLNQGTVMLKDGNNVMRVERDSVFPHIRQFIFEPLE
jgi:hypothetical protein